MIIRCIKCETKFRFEDSLITGDGVWVRCNRCRHVFFQDAAGDMTIGDMTGFLKETRIVSPDRVEEKGGQYIAEAAAGMAESGDDIRPEKEGDEAIFSRIKEVREAMEGEDGDLALAVKEFDAPVSSTGQALEGPAEEEDEEETPEERPEPVEGKKKKGFLGKFLAWLFLLLTMVLLLGGIYLWMFPQARQQAVELLSPYSPLFERLAKEQISRDPVAAQVAIGDVKQRFVNNWLMGSLRVVEGNAFNTAKYSLTRIQVRGRLYDAADAVLGEKVSFCGNLLTDAELATMTEDEIGRKLSQPLGSTISNDRITSQGQIPFMIIFAHDQSAVAKVTVMTAGAEKLLE